MSYLIVIGGLGDHDWLMRLALIGWRVRGYHTHYYKFGWMTGDVDLKHRVAELEAHIDSLPANADVYVLGTSAGGIIAALLLARRPQRVKKAIALCSPLNRFRHSSNELLNRALLLWHFELPSVTPETLAKLGSFRAQQDTIVNPNFCKLPGVHNAQLPTRGHVATIARALTTGSKVLHSWLRS